MKSSPPSFLSRFSSFWAFLVNLPPPSARPAHPRVPTRRKHKEKKGGRSSPTPTANPVSSKTNHHKDQPKSGRSKSSISEVQRLTLKSSRLEGRRAKHSCSAEKHNQVAQSQAGVTIRGPATGVSRIKLREAAIVHRYHQANTTNRADAEPMLDRDPIVHAIGICGK